MVNILSLNKPERKKESTFNCFAIQFAFFTLYHLPVSLEVILLIIPILNI